MPEKQPSLNSYSANIIPTEKPVEKPKLSKEDLERGQQDIQAVNNDLKLLSTLLGRPIDVDDLPQITNQFGGSRGAAAGRRKVPTVTTTTTTTTTTTPAPTTTTTLKPAIVREVELLQSLLNPKKPNVVAPEKDADYYGKTDDAILATILRQQGIGPSHNNIPIEVN